MEARDTETARVFHDEKYLRWELNQTEYVHSLVDTFGPDINMEDFTPDAVWIEIKFMTWDATNTSAYVEDYITLEIRSNGETQSDACNYTSLILINSMDGQTKSYTIADDSHRRLQTSGYNSYDNSYNNNGGSYNNYGSSNDN